jgi:hypothetical protein
VLGLGHPVELHGERKKFGRLGPGDRGDGEQEEDDKNTRSFHEFFDHGLHGSE